MAIDTESKIPLLDAGEFPVLGMRTSVNKATLGLGEHHLLSDVRFKSRTLKLRYGVEKVGSAPAIPTGSLYCVAAYGATINNAFYFISIWHMASGAAVFSYNLTTGACTELTASGAGQFSASTTRFATTTNVYSFAVCRNPWTGREMLVIQNGEDSPRVYDPGSSYSAKLAIHTEVALPGSDTSYLTIPTFPVFWAVKDNGASTPGGGGAGFVFSDSGSNPNNTWLFTAASTIAVNDTCQVTVSSSIDLSNSRQLILLAETELTDWLFNVKIEISDTGAGFSTIWDPSATPNTCTVGIAPNDASSRKVWYGFGLDHIATTSRDAVNILKMTWVQGTAPATSTAITVHLAAGSGQSLGQTYHAFTYGNRTSGGESRAVYPKVQPEHIKNLGGSTANVSRIIFSENLYYNFTRVYLNTTAAEQAKGVDTFNVYRMDFGEPDGSYTYVESVTLSTYSGSWSFSSGSAGSVLTSTETAKAQDKIKNIEAPNQFSKGIPISLCMMNASSRLFCGAVTSNTVGTPNYPKLWISSSMNPFRFTEVPTKATDGTVQNVDGEYPVGFAYSSLSAFGEGTIWFLTRQRVYRLAGYTANTLSYRFPVAAIGCAASTSIKEKNGMLFFVDVENRIVRVVRDEEILSDERVEDLLDGVLSGVQGNLSATFIDRAYFLSYGTASGVSTVSNNTIFYETRRNQNGQEFGFAKDNYKQGALKANFWVSSQTQNYFIGDDDYVYQLTDDEDDDEGTQIVGTIGSKEFHLANREGFTCKYARSISDQDANGDLVVDVTYRPSGKTQTASASLTSSNSQEWVPTNNFDSGDTGPFDGVGAYAVAQYFLPGGSEIFSLDIEIAPSDVKPVSND